MKFQKGDFVIVTLDTKEKFKGQIKEIEKDTYAVEICVNKRKSEANEVEIVYTTIDKIETLIPKL